MIHGTGNKYYVLIPGVVIRLKNQRTEPSVQSAAMGIRTPVASVRGSHDWPDYTIAAQLLNNIVHIFT